MAEYKDLYLLTQSETESIVNIGEEIRIDLELEDSVVIDSGTVFGTIVDEDGDPVEGVTVKITDLDYNPQYHALTDETGQYSIGDVEADNQYYIFAIKDNFDLQQGTPFNMQKSQQVERDFTMTASPETANSLVAGDVVNLEGDPLVGVTVRLFDNSGETPQLIKTTHTNDFGQYALFDVPQGVYLITSSLLGYTTTSTTFIIDGPSQVRNIILSMAVDPIAKRGTINGIIRDKEGIPVAGAYVILFSVTTDEEGKEVLTPIKNTWTNSQGLYLFEQVPIGDYKIKSNKIETE